MNSASNAAVTNLAAILGLNFPQDTQVLHEDDGGGRDPRFGYYEWTFYSTNSLPVSLNGNPEASVTRPVANLIRFVESCTNGRRILDPISAGADRKDINGVRYSTSLIRTKSGDYLVIQRINVK